MELPDISILGKNPTRWIAKNIGEISINKHQAH